MDLRTILRAGNHFEQNLGAGTGAAISNPYAEATHDFENSADPIAFSNEVSEKNPHSIFLCKVGLPSFPARTFLRNAEAQTIDTVFDLSEGVISAELWMTEEFLLKVGRRSSWGWAGGSHERCPKEGPKMISGRHHSFLIPVPHFFFLVAIFVAWKAWKCIA